MTTAQTKRIALAQAARVLHENYYKLEEQATFSPEDTEKIEEVYTGVIEDIEQQLQELLVMRRD